MIRGRSSFSIAFVRVGARYGSDTNDEPESPPWRNVATHHYCRYFNPRLPSRRLSGESLRPQFILARVEMISSVPIPLPQHPTSFHTRRIESPMTRHHPKNLPLIPLSIKFHLA
jgi:hypothetical protein